MQEFSEQIIYEDNPKDVLEEIRHSTLPLVIYGSGDVAREVYDYLKTDSIKIADIMVDDDWYELCAGDIFDKRKILKKTEVDKKYDFYNIVMGHSHYEQKKQLLLQQQVQLVFCLTGIAYRQISNIKDVRCFIKKNEKVLAEVYNDLADDISKKNMIAFYNSKANNNPDYIISAFDYCRNVFDNDVVQLNDKEVYVDVGAYNGDTIKSFLNVVKFMYKKIYGIEAIIDNYLNMKKMLENVDNLQMFNIAAGKETNTMLFKRKSTNQSFMMTEEKDEKILKVNAEKLDEIVDIPPTLIKFNIFKGTYEALIGATRILQSYKPKLIISIGFDEVELLNVTKQIKSIQPRYKFYLRFLSAMDAKLYLYAV